MATLEIAPKATVFYGPIISSDTISFYTASPRALVAVNSRGFIEWIEHDVQASQVQRVLKHKINELGLGMVQVVLLELEEGEFLMPGFVDTHTVSLSIIVAESLCIISALIPQHAPQVPNIGTYVKSLLNCWTN